MWVVLVFLVEFSITQCALTMLSDWQKLLLLFTFWTQLVLSLGAGNSRYRYYHRNCYTCFNGYHGYNTGHLGPGECQSSFDLADGLYVAVKLNFWERGFELECGGTHYFNDRIRPAVCFCDVLDLANKGALVIHREGLMPSVHCEQMSDL